MIKGVSKVVIDVEDQQRAKEFWTTTMSFELVQDVTYGNERWLEVRSPDKATILVLGWSSTGPGDRDSVPEMLPTSNVFFCCDDLRETYGTLRSRGVEFPQPPARQSFGWWSLFVDSDGNRFALGPAGQ
jgi:predicted enzyme related to lactoylglutathione lyase